MAIQRTPSEDGSGSSGSIRESESENGEGNPEDYGGDSRFDEEPDFSDPEDFVDDVDDETLMPDLLRQRPKESDGVDNVIVVDGIRYPCMPCLRQLAPGRKCPPPPC